jgi:competence protein ComFB
MEERKESYELVNTAEQLVRKKVRELMPGFDMCQCEKCYLDTCAIILNQLASHFVTTRKGELLTLLDATDSQYKIDLTVYVLKALQKVKDSPQH